MSLNKNAKMQLPKNCKCLSVEEMMKNESGWYVNFNTGEVYVTYRDIDTTIRWVISLVEAFNATMEVSASYIEAEIRKNTPMYSGANADSSGGIGISINQAGFRIFALNQEQLKLANSNIFIF